MKSVKGILKFFFKRPYTFLQKKALYSTFFGSIFINWVKVYRAGSCKFEISRELFPLGYLSRFLFGLYESQEIYLVNKYLSPEAKVLELGACVGILSCILNKKLDQPENMVVVEANPDLIDEINKHKSANQCHFNIENVVVSDQKMLTFYTYSIPFAGSLEKKTHRQDLIDTCVEKQVPGKTVQDIKDQYGIAFDTLVMDIEGGEFDFIDQNLDFIGSLDTLLIEFHSFFEGADAKIKRSLQQINDKGLSLIEKKGTSYYFQRQ